MHFGCSIASVCLLFATTPAKASVSFSPCPTCPVVQRPGVLRHTRRYVSYLPYLGYLGTYPFARRKKPYVISSETPSEKKKASNTSPITASILDRLTRKTCPQTPPDRLSESPSPNKKPKHKNHSEESLPSPRPEAAQPCDQADLVCGKPIRSREGGRPRAMTGSLAEHPCHPPPEIPVIHDSWSEVSENHPALLSGPEREGEGHCDASMNWTCRLRMLAEDTFPPMTLVSLLPTSFMPSITTLPS